MLILCLITILIIKDVVFFLIMIVIVLVMVVTHGMLSLFLGVRYNSLRLQTALKSDEVDLTGIFDGCYFLKVTSHVFIVAVRTWNEA